MLAVSSAYFYGAVGICFHLVVFSHTMLASGLLGVEKGQCEGKETRNHVEPQFLFEWHDVERVLSVARAILIRNSANRDRHTLDSLHFIGMHAASFLHHKEDFEWVYTSSWDVFELHSTRGIEDLYIKSIIDSILMRGKHPKVLPHDQTFLF